LHFRENGMVLTTLPIKISPLKRTRENRRQPFKFNSRLVGLLLGKRNSPGSILPGTLALQNTLPTILPSGK